MAVTFFQAHPYIWRTTIPHDRIVEQVLVSEQLWIHSLRAFTLQGRCADPDMADSELPIPNYQVIVLDRNRHGGGGLMYVHNCLSYK